MIWARDFDPTKVSESPEYFVYCGLSERNCWTKRSDQSAKGEFLEVPFNILPYLIIIALIADHVVTIGTLKDRLPNFLCNRYLNGANNARDPAVLRTVMGA